LELETGAIMAIQWDDTAGELAVLVREHDVGYEVTPEERASSRRRPLARVGYRLRLIGNPRDSHGPITPGCPVCRDTVRALIRIANAVLPHDERATRYEIDPFDGAWHTSAARPRGVELSVVLIGRRDSSAPDAACQIACIDDIERELQRLGVRREASHAGRSGPRYRSTAIS
jgi:hypothetical protein